MSSSLVVSVGPCLRGEGKGKGGEGKEKKEREMEGDDDRPITHIHDHHQLVVYSRCLLLAILCLPASLLLALQTAPRVMLQ